MKRRALVLIGAAALLLRLLRGPARWDEITLAYAAYTEPVARALSAGEPGRAVATWVGLHPPLHAALLWGIDQLWPAPALWIGLSLLASAGAVLAVGRAGGSVAMLALASSPLQLAYAAEVNNYPLAVLALTLCLAAASGPVGLLAAAAVLAGWSHVLAGLGAVGVVLWRARALPRREAARLCAAVGLGLLPVGAGALRRLWWDSSWSQAGMAGGQSLEWLLEAGRRCGPEGVLLGALALIGLRGSALAATIPLGLTLLASLVLGAAAPHQFPYLLLFGPPLALALGAAATRPRLGALIVLLCLSRGLRAGLSEVQTLATLGADQKIERAIDVALAEAGPHDRLWLVAPALRPDDDKEDTGPALWRLSPWAAWHPVALSGFEYTDPRAGAPHRWRGLTIHTSTTLDLSAFDAAAAATLVGGGAVWVLLYEHAPAAGLEDDVRLALRPYRVVERRFAVDEEAGIPGPDLLFRVEGRR